MQNPIMTKGCGADSFADGLKCGFKMIDGDFVMERLKVAIDLIHHPIRWTFVKLGLQYMFGQNGLICFVRANPRQSFGNDWNQPHQSCSAQCNENFLSKISHPMRITDLQDLLQELGSSGT